MDQQLPKLGNDLRFEFQRLKLSEKVSALLDRAVHTLRTSQEQIASVKGVSPTLQTSASGPQTSNSINSDKENNNNVKKRKRTCDTNHSHNDELSGDNKTKDSSSHRLKHWSKKRRVLEPYCFLSSKALQRHKRRNYFRSTLSGLGKTIETKTEDEEGAEDDGEEWSNSSTEDFTGESEGDDAEDQDDEYNCEQGSDLFNGNRPAKESTPRNKSQDSNMRAPILPVSEQF